MLCVTFVTAAVDDADVGGGGGGRWTVCVYSDGVTTITAAAEVGKEASTPPKTDHSLRASAAAAADVGHSLETVVVQFLHLTKDTGRQ